MIPSDTPNPIQAVSLIVDFNNDVKRQMSCAQAVSPGVGNVHAWVLRTSTESLPEKIIHKSREANEIELLLPRRQDM